MLDLLLSTKVIGIVSGSVVSVWFFVWFIWPRLEDLIRGHRKSADERAAELKAAYYREQQSMEASPRSFSMAAPRVEILRIGQRPGGVTCLLVNRGGTAMNLTVEPLGAFEARIEPTVTLGNGETGRISIQGPPLSPHMQFQLTYDDSYGQRVVRHFSYSDTESTFKEI
jgi:hypothetical protein